ncbi:MAG TPA: hypothetical protein VF125_03390 [Solirubrobacterales bacterium]
MDAAAKRSGRSRVDKRSPKDQMVCEALKHPVRVRILVLALHTDEDFESLSFEERKAISRSTLQMLIARADGAIYQGTFDKRADRHPELGSDGA